MNKTAMNAASAGIGNQGAKIEGTITFISDEMKGDREFQLNFRKKVLYYKEHFQMSVCRLTVSQFQTIVDATLLQARVPFVRHSSTMGIQINDNGERLWSVPNTGHLCINLSSGEITPQWQSGIVVTAEHLSAIYPVIPRVKFAPQGTLGEFKAIVKNYLIPCHGKMSTLHAIGTAGEMLIKDIAEALAPSSTMVLIGASGGGKTSWAKMAMSFVGLTNTIGPNSTESAKLTFLSSQSGFNNCIDDALKLGTATEVRGGISRDTIFQQSDSNLVDLTLEHKARQAGSRVMVTTNIPAVELGIHTLKNPDAIKALVSRLLFMRPQFTEDAKLDTSIVTRAIQAIENAHRFILHIHSGFFLNGGEKYKRVFTEMFNIIAEWDSTVSITEELGDAARRVLLGIARAAASSALAAHLIDEEISEGEYEEYFGAMITESTETTVELTSMKQANSTPQKNEKGNTGQMLHTVDGFVQTITSLLDNGRLTRDDIINRDAGRVYIIKRVLQDRLSTSEWQTAKSLFNTLGLSTWKWNAQLRIGDKGYRPYCVTFNILEASSPVLSKFAEFANIELPEGAIEVNTVESSACVHYEPDSDSDDLEASLFWSTLKRRKKTNIISLVDDGTDSEPIDGSGGGGGGYICDESGGVGDLDDADSNESEEQPSHNLRSKQRDPKEIKEKENKKNEKAKKKKAKKRQR